MLEVWSEIEALLARPIGWRFTCYARVCSSISRIKSGLDDTERRASIWALLLCSAVLIYCGMLWSDCSSHFLTDHCDPSVPWIFGAVAIATTIIILVLSYFWDRVEGTHLRFVAYAAMSIAFAGLILTAAFPLVGVIALMFWMLLMLLAFYFNASDTTIVAAIVSLATSALSLDVAVFRMQRNHRSSSDDRRAQVARSLRTNVLLVLCGLGIAAIFVFTLPVKPLATFVSNAQTVREFLDHVSAYSAFAIIGTLATALCLASENRLSSIGLRMPEILAFRRFCSRVGVLASSCALLAVSNTAAATTSRAQLQIVRIDDRLRQAEMHYAEAERRSKSTSAVAKSDAALLDGLSRDFMLAIGSDPVFRDLQKSWPASRSELTGRLARGSHSKRLQEWISNKLRQDVALALPGHWATIRRRLYPDRDLTPSPADVTKLRSLLVDQVVSLGFEKTIHVDGTVAGRIASDPIEDIPKQVIARVVDRGYELFRDRLLQPGLTQSRLREPLEVPLTAAEASETKYATNILALAHPSGASSDLGPDVISFHELPEAAKTAEQSTVELDELFRGLRVIVFHL